MNDKVQCWSCYQFKTLDKYDQNRQNTMLKAEEELCSVVRDAHEQECCLNYEQLDTTSQNENL